jgi:hypothetical protein
VEGPSPQLLKICILVIEFPIGKGQGIQILYQISHLVSDDGFPHFEPQVLDSTPISPVINRLGQLEYRVLPFPLADNIHLGILDGLLRIQGDVGATKEGKDI